MMATKAPTGTEIPRVLIVVVLGLIVIVVVFAVFPFLSQIFSPQAKAAISDAHEVTTGCTQGSGSTYYNYTWTFTLTNTGNTDENVTVAVVPTSPVYVISSPIFTQQYSVPKAQSRLEVLIYPATSEGCYSDRTSQIGLQVTSPP